MRKEEDVLDEVCAANDCLLYRRNILQRHHVVGAYGFSRRLNAEIFDLCAFHRYARRFDRLSTFGSGIKIYIITNRLALM